MIFSWTKEDSFNLKRIADAICKLASIEVIDRNHQPNKLNIEVTDQSLEALANNEAEANENRLAKKLNEDNDRFWPEDNLSLSELEDLQ